MSKKRQLTLGAFNFTKTIKHRDKEYLCDIPTSYEETNKPFKCSHCTETFQKKQGLSVHVLCKHPQEQQQPSSSKSIVGECNIGEPPAKKRATENVNVTNRPDVEVIEIEDDGDKHKTTARRGRDTRRQYKASFKADVIVDVEAGEHYETVAGKYRVDRSLVLKWFKAKDKIAKAAASEYRNYLKIRPSRKYIDLYDKLFKLFKDSRSKGHRVDFNWLWSKARMLYRELTGDPNAIVRKHVITTFIKKFKIRMRARQRNRKLSKEEFRKDLEKWHGTTRERLIRSGKRIHYDTKWGYFKPMNRFNVDQSPLPFAINMKKTYHHYDEDEDQRKSKVWISQPGSGLDKRQCTLQICCRPCGKQPKLAIIFRGLGKRITSEEKNAWHKNVDVYFQSNAWADTKFSCEWVKKTLKDAVNDLDHFALFCDNLTAQVSSEFKESVSDQSGVCWYGLPNATDLWQPVDAGYAELLKRLVNQKFHAWLDSDENADRWYGNVDSFSAKERRILITHWAGDAYDQLVSPEYDAFRKRLWEKTGCLITADGSDDSKIQPEGLPNYKPPEPCIYVEASTEAPISNEVDPDPMTEEQLEPFEDEENPPAVVPVLEDNISDRVLDHQLVGRKVRAWYENGWFVGEIVYFNNKLNELKIDFDDGTSDYVCEDDFNELDLILQ